MTAPGIAYKETAHLLTNTTIVFQGKKYLIEKINPKNYVIKSVDTGKRYNLNRHANITVADEQVKPAEVKAPEFGIGDVVEFQAKTGRMRGVVFKVNQGTASVVIPNFHGTYKVGFPLMTKIPATTEFEL